MNTDFRLLPESASTFADRVDHLYLFLVIVSAFFVVLICSLVVTFGIHFRRTARRSHASLSENYWLEASWAVIPLILTMVMFVWGARIFFDMRTSPENALEIQVVGKQWMWKIQHPQGRAEINQLHIPVGQPVRLNMISQDVIHSFFIPAFRTKQDVLPGRYSSLWFEATRKGQFHLFCAEYCGTEHSLMRGTVIVMSPDEYSDWLAGENGETPEVLGQRLFERFRCGTCHKQRDDVNGPALAGLPGKKVTLKDGATVVADDQYLRDSILDSAKQIVEGYEPVMPAYQGQLNESEVLHLIAYLRTMTTVDTRVPDELPTTNNN